MNKQHQIFRTKVELTDELPLTCTRKGTCCHGNQVFLNPWELAVLAREKQLSPSEFRKNYCEQGGILLRFKGKVDHRGKASCNLYVDNFGCSVHEARPLACRLFPLGRQIQNEKAHYFYQGAEFPCMDGCPEVVQLPKLKVDAYLKGQLTESFEKAQDLYLEMMQNLADGAFALLLDSGLASTGDTKTLLTWRKIGQENASEMVKRIGSEWLEALILPQIDEVNDPEFFIEKHATLIQQKAQAEFGALHSVDEFRNGSVLMMTLALYLAYALGADPKGLSEHWIEVAKSHGAREK